MEYMLRGFWDKYTNPIVLNHNIFRSGYYFLKAKLGVWTDIIWIIYHNLQLNGYYS